MGKNEVKKTGEVRIREKIKTGLCELEEEKTTLRNT